MTWVPFVGWMVMAALLGRGLVRSVMVREYEAALLYRRGKLIRLLGPGSHYLMRAWSDVVVIDLRTRFLTVSGQELLSADHVGIKVSLVLKYAVKAPEVAVNTVESYVDGLYIVSQLALRELVAGMRMEDLLSGRGEMGTRLTARLAGEADRIGLRLDAAEIKDVMFPGELKKIYAEVVRAQKEGQAALERARGETAALRSLANAAKLLDDHPGLLQLRLLQTMGGGAHGNPSVVVGVPPHVVSFDIKKKG